MPQRKNKENEEKEKQKLDKPKFTFQEAYEERLNIVEQTLTEYKSTEIINGLVNSAIATTLFMPLECFSRAEKRNPKEILDVLNLFELITLKINECLVYVPLKTDFCRLLGISMGTFNKYKNNEDSSYENAIYMVEDFIGGFALQSSMNGSTKEISTVFMLKSNLGWKDTPEQVVNNNILVTERNTSDLLKEYMARIPKNKDE